MNSQSLALVVRLPVEAKDRYTATLHSPFGNFLCVPTARLLIHGRTLYKSGYGKEKRSYISWKDQFRQLQLSNNINLKAAAIQKQNHPLIKAVVTVEPSSLLFSSNDPKHAPSLQFESNSQMLLLSNEDYSKLDDRERLRRSRISKANKGNVPWNKGRKHTPETLQRIRERTRIAMQDPKVKLKLMNIGHAQSEVTRVKIGIGVREGWQRRREKLLLQETCFLEWKNRIAEASRKGYCGEEELQWDSYQILDKELKKEWFESIEKRKTMPRPKGSKRAPKSLEQRRKISEAISAKWADPGYRDRVCSALAKYHGVPVGVERKPKRRKSVETQPSQRVRVKKKPVEREDAIFEASAIKKLTAKKKKNAAPSYKDPMASTKLEMIKRIKAQRMEMENRKQQATERAKLLIAEAERAAKALEVAALKSPLARASLLETRKLIAEATRSIESIEKGETMSQDTGDNYSFTWDGMVTHHAGSPEGPHVHNVFPVEPRVNGTRQLSLSDESTSDLYFEKLKLQKALNGSQSLPSIRDVEIALAAHSCFPSAFQPNSASKETGATDLQVGLSKNIDNSNQAIKGDEKQESGARKMECCKTPAKTKKKWISGRLVEVEDD